MARKVPNRVSYGYVRNGIYVDGKCAAKLNETRDGKALVKADASVVEAGRAERATATVVRRIFDLRLTKHSPPAIARILNAEGVPGPSGGEWTNKTVANIIANPIYKGEIVFGRLSGNKKNRRRVPENKWRREHDAAIAIVSPKEWADAQTTRTVNRTGEYRAGVAGGLLTCHACGNSMSVLGTGDGRLNYGCRRHSSAGSCPAPTNIKKDACDAFVDEIVSAKLAGGTIDTSTATHTVAELSAKLADVRERIDTLPKAIDIRNPKFGDYLADLQAEEAEAEDALVEAESLAGALGSLPSAREYLSLDVPARNRVAGALIDRIVVSPPVSRSKFAPILDRLSVEWR